MGKCTAPSPHTVPAHGTVQPNDEECLSSWLLSGKEKPMWNVCHQHTLSLGAAKNKRLEKHIAAPGDLQSSGWQPVWLAVSSLWEREQCTGHPRHWLVVQEGAFQGPSFRFTCLSADSAWHVLNALGPPKISWEAAYWVQEPECSRLITACALALTEKEKSRVYMQGSGFNVLAAI